MIRELKHELLRTLYPDDIKCIVCGKEMHPSRYGVCDSCGFQHNVNFCKRCGRHKIGIGEYCSECSDIPLAFDEARSSVNYVGDAKSIIYRLKYGNARYLARPIAEYMLDTLLLADWDIDCFTFVPIHKKRQKKRGYNQAELIAEALAAHTTTPCIPLLEKVIETPNQAKLNRDERMKNLSGSFAACSGVPKHVCLIDDVMTTGSTASECSRVLKRAGASVVYVLTFASVPERPMLDNNAKTLSDL